MNPLNDRRALREEETFLSQLDQLEYQVAQICRDAPCFRQCSRLNDLLQKVYEIRVGLNQIETDLLQTHLKCCISPSIQVPEEVILALSKLSEKRHGGIIVLEREDSLVKYLQGGVDIDAAISAPMLEAIFYPGSVLHDGAVIIRESRIWKANILLPLSPHSEKLDALGLGSRHRAALGLSTVSDALIIVVSEEKGWISMAFRSQLYPNLGTFALLDKLADGPVKDAGRS